MSFLLSGGLVIKNSTFFRGLLQSGHLIIFLLPCKNKDIVSCLSRLFFLSNLTSLLLYKPYHLTTLKFFGEICWINDVINSSIVKILRNLSHFLLSTLIVIFFLS